MAEVAVKVRDRPLDEHHRPVGEPLFDVEFVWRALYIEGGSHTEYGPYRMSKVWHVTSGERYSSQRPVPLCRNAGWKTSGRRAMTVNEMAEVGKWAAYKVNRICHSCQRVMNARARARGVH